MTKLDFTMFSDFSRLANSMSNLLDAITHMTEDLRIIIITATVTGYVALLIFAFFKIKECCEKPSHRDLETYELSEKELFEQWRSTARNNNFSNGDGSAKNNGKAFV